MFHIFIYIYNYLSYIYIHVSLSTYKYIHIHISIYIYIYVHHVNCCNAMQRKWAAKGPGEVGLAYNKYSTCTYMFVVEVMLKFKCNGLLKQTVVLGKDIGNQTKVLQLALNKKQICLCVCLCYTHIHPVWSFGLDSERR